MVSLSGPYCDCQRLAVGGGPCEGEYHIGVHLGDATARYRVFLAEEPMYEVFEAWASRSDIEGMILCYKTPPRLCSRCHTPRIELWRGDVRFERIGPLPIGV